MFITPMEPIRAIGIPSQEQEQGKKSAVISPFQEMLQNAIQDLKTTDQVSNQDSQQLATGQMDDLHTLGINSTKAYLAERMVVEVRNRALDAYSEIMRINL